MSQACQWCTDVQCTARVFISTAAHGHKAANAHDASPVSWLRQTEA